MSNIFLCEKCQKPITKNMEKKYHSSVKKKSGDNTHNHYGTLFYMYNMCEQYHLGKKYPTKIIWNPCVRCKLLGFTKFFSEQTCDVDLYYKISDFEKRLENLEIKIKKMDTPCTSTFSEMSPLPISSQISSETFRENPKGLVLEDLYDIPLNSLEDKTDTRANTGGERKNDEKGEEKKTEVEQPKKRDSFTEITVPDIVLQDTTNQNLSKKYSKFKKGRNIFD